ncbi:Nif3-like dinuclear metal center hexameric protein [Methanosarcinales archaeon ex4572_44]|nr:MAG: Nif3-like dinuclear metal center hexameric protein [Methanosarcinales archaeon ex4484_138]PHP45273.1 MAG: Nif3-like dinuclear metal center hexameric protein [Methanosarcinales archaeon ex4572_44]RLG25617.1 MAG: Nif3-like dinuclear metal center hexameric protein [Methanosarcinales archaeon]RLG28631.1 MAG: Nif3-like dinuclear metal center hexameric protein [Methanosarcinales archaeon]
MKLSEFVSILEEIAPPEEALDFDQGRIGLVLDRGGDVGRVAVSLDPTDFVLREAGRIGADLLITHHTLIFDPITRLSQTLSDSLKIALLNDLSLYVMHTNFDCASGGINDVLAEILGLRDVEACGIGRTGLIKPCELDCFAGLVVDRLDTHVRWVGDGLVERVMVVGGSGFDSEYIDMACERGADVLVSGELRHSAIRYAMARGLSLLDATHYATENPGMKKLCERLPIEAVFIDDEPIVGVRER